MAVLLHSVILKYKKLRYIASPQQLLWLLLMRLRYLWNMRWLLMTPGIRRVDGSVEAFKVSIIETFNKTSLVDDADKILSGYIECFGSHQLIRIPWNKDIFSGYEWEKGKYYKHYRLLGAFPGADVRVPWELSRCHHLIPVAKAYAMTGESKYSDRVISDLDDWIYSNPFAQSVNWTCSMDVAIRSVNWIWAVSLCSSAITNAALKQRIDKSLYQHGTYIWGNLEKRVVGYSSNHYYANLVGLIYLGVYFDKNGKGKKWFEFGIRQFFVETRIQFHSTGVHYELSTSYHRLVVEMLLSVITLLKRIKFEVPADIEHRAQLAVNYIFLYTRGDGTAPQIGDSDDGRLHIFGKYNQWKKDDHRHILAIGHLLWAKQEWALNDDSLYSDAAILLNHSIPQLRSSTQSRSDGIASFVDAGIIIIRSRKFQLLAKFSNRGAHETGGWHTHNDILSFDLAIFGIPFIVDPGTGEYSGDIRIRNYFRSTKMHNTVCVDNEEINSLLNDYDNLWENGGEARGSIVKAEQYNDEICVTGFHTGYQKLNDPVIHTRKWKVDKDVLSILDSFSGSAGHYLEWNYICDPKITLIRQNEKQINLAFEDTSVVLTANIPLYIKENIFSPSFKKQISTKSIYATANDGSTEYNFEIH